MTAGQTGNANELRAAQVPATAIAKLTASRRVDAAVQVARVETHLGPAARRLQ